MARLEEFLASPEANALGGVDAAAREAVARRLFHSLREVGVPLEQLGSSDAHGWLLHALPEEFRPRDPLAPAIAPVLGALFDFTERTSSRKLTALRAVCEEMLPELAEALRTGHAHHHHDHDHEPETPYVRAAPKVGRNDPCPCGSGKKFKKCHGAAS